MNVNNATGQVNSVLMGAANTLKPQILNMALEKYGDYGMGGVNLYSTISTLGEVKTNPGLDISHFEYGALQTNFRVSANVASPGAGNPQTVVVSLADVQATTGAVIPKIGDIVRYTGNVYGQITNKVAGGGTFTLTITPSSTTLALPAVVANQILAILTSSYAEGTTIPESTNRQPDKYTFPTNHIIKTAFITTGTAMELQRWYDSNSLGNNFSSTWLEGQLETEVKHSIEISNAMLASPISDNPAVTPTMYGVRNWVEAFGNDFGSIPAGTESIATFDLVNRVLNKKLAPREFCWLQGMDRSIGIENALADLFAQNGIALKTEAFNKRFTMGYESTANESGIAFNFKAALKGLRTHYFMPMAHFAFDQNLGATGQDFNSLAILMPLGQVKTQQGLMKAHWRFLHLGNRHFSVVNTGRAVPNQGATDNVDVARTEVLTQGGNQFFVPEHWGIIRS